MRNKYTIQKIKKDVLIDVSVYCDLRVETEYNDLRYVNSANFSSYMVFHRRVVNAVSFNNSADRLPSTLPCRS